MTKALRVVHPEPLDGYAPRLAREVVPAARQYLISHIEYRIEPAGALLACPPSTDRANVTFLPQTVRMHATEAAKASVVYVIDDDEVVRDRLGRLLQSVGLQTEMFANPAEFVAFRQPEMASCLILDVRLRGTSGLVFQREIVRLGMRMPVVFMTEYGDIEMSVKAMKAGAVDFLVKPFRDQDMLDAVSEALARDHKRLEREQPLTTLRAAYDSLKPREKQVLGKILRGLRNKQIASEVFLSEITVKIHRGKIMRKMGARSVPELVFKAAALGLGPE